MSLATWTFPLLFHLLSCTAFSSSSSSLYTKNRREELLLQALYFKGLLSESFPDFSLISLLSKHSYNDASIKDAADALEVINDKEIIFLEVLVENIKNQELFFVLSNTKNISTEQFVLVDDCPDDIRQRLSLLSLLLPSIAGLSQVDKRFFIFTVAYLVEKKSWDKLRCLIFSNSDPSELFSSTTTSKTTLESPILDENAKKDELDSKSQVSTSQSSSALQLQSTPWLKYFLIYGGVGIGLLVLILMIIVIINKQNNKSTSVSDETL